MSKNKLTKFAELDVLPNVFQYPYKVLKDAGITFPFKGKWCSEVFHNQQPIIVELGCGHGEYTIDLARRHPEHNYIGIDIKGNRMWNGATTAYKEGLSNVRFLRTEIELLPYFFSEGEVTELWLTFPDPQMKKVSKRLTSINFLMMYRSILQAPKILNLKTDSLFLFTYTKRLAELNGLTVLEDLDDVHSEDRVSSELNEIETFYESQWRARGITIKYLRFALDNLIQEPMEVKEEIPWDSYRSYGRSIRTSTESI